MISIKEYVALKKEELKNKVEKGNIPCLYIIQVGDNPASNSYVKGKHTDCEEVGFKCRHIHYKDTTTETLVGLIEELNLDPKCHGIIVQLPLPPHIDVKEVQLAIDPYKDVDGFHPLSQFKPCTPLGVINFLKYNNYNFEGKNALVIGRSDIVGKPLAQMLTDLNCTVTLAHSKTKEIDAFIENSDLVFTAIDKIEHYTTLYRSFFSATEIVVDIGLGKGADNKLHGNLTKPLCEILKYRGVEVYSGIGNVGLLTRLQLLENTLKACELQQMD